MQNQGGIRWLQIQFMLPAIIFIAVVSIYPFVSGVIYSLKDGSLLNSGDFVGINNFLQIFQMKEFWSAFRFSVVFTIFSVLGSYFVGLILALCLNMNLPGRGLLRIALLVPWVVSSVVSMFGWKNLIGDQSGLINQMIKFLGFEPILFLSTSGWVVFSVILVKVWKSFPFMMVTLLATLQTINKDLYEAASIDGGNKWQLFVNITLPQLKSSTLMCCILMSIWSFNDFDVLWLLTKGGPMDMTQNVIIMSYKYAFIKNATGIGSALGILSLIVLMILALLLMRVQKNDK